MKNEPNIGQLATGLGHRDAIHIAVIQVESDETVYPGCRVGICGPNKVQRMNGTTVGIVDPFLDEPVNPGEKFWLFLYPKTITSLAHHWSHPAFPDTATPKPASGSEAWLIKYAEDNGLSYAVLMEGARMWLEAEEWLCLGGLLEGKHVSDDFWIHYQNVTGKIVEGEKQGNFFTCSY